MDIATLIGLIGAFVIVGSAIVLGGSPIIFVNIPSFLIVVLGAVFVVIMRYSFQKMKNAISVALKAFMFKVDSPEEIIKEITVLAKLARKEGPLGLEKVQIKNAFLARGIRLIVDSTDAEVAKSILMRDRLSTVARHDEGQSIFMALNEVAPAMGMIGTLIGLVQMLSNMSDPSAIGPAMAVALLTTLYGAILSNMVAKPIADKLSLRSTEEDFVNSLIMDAVFGMARGLSPAVVEEGLVSYLSLSRRKAFEESQDSKAA